MNDFLRINNSAITVLPLYNSIVPSLDIYVGSAEPVPKYFNMVCFDNGLINTYLNGHFCMAFKKELYQKPIHTKKFSLEFLMNKYLELEIIYDSNDIIVVAHVVPEEWKTWITHIKNNAFDLLDDEYVHKSSFLDPEVAACTSEIGKWITNYNLPWGIINRYPKYVNRIKEEIAKHDNVEVSEVKDVGKWPISIFDPEKECFKPELLINL